MKREGLGKGVGREYIYGFYALRKVFSVNSMFLFIFFFFEIGI